MISQENVKLAHKVIQGMSIKATDKIYDKLGVGHIPLDPESFYGGVKNPDTGKKIPEKYKCKAMIKDLLSVIKKGKPVCKEKHSEYKYVVWLKGDGKTLYKHVYSGIMCMSGKNHDQFVADLPFFASKKVKTKIQSKGKYGLGVDYNTAVKLWGKKIIDNLPIVKSEEK